MLDLFEFILHRSTLSDDLEFCSEKYQIGSTNIKCSSVVEFYGLADWNQIWIDLIDKHFASEEDVVVVLDCAGSFLVEDRQERLKIFRIFSLCQIFAFFLQYRQFSTRKKGKRVLIVNEWNQVLSSLNNPTSITNFKEKLKFASLLYEQFLQFASEEDFFVFISSQMTKNHNGQMVPICNEVGALFANYRFFFQPSDNTTSTTNKYANGSNLGFHIVT